MVSTLGTLSSEKLGGFKLRCFHTNGSTCAATAWQKAKKDDQLVKFGGGFYCGKVEGIYCFNGFFMSMRSAFVVPGSSIHYFVVEFDSKVGWYTSLFASQFTHFALNFKFTHFTSHATHFTSLTIYIVCLSFCYPYTQDLKWESFRGEVLGPTDPADAPAGSLRAAVYADWWGLYKSQL
jgi:hypothetical protein